VNLRCFGVATPRADDKVALEVPDIDAEFEWEISALPWNLVKAASSKSELCPELIQAIEPLVNTKGVQNRTVGAAVAFLYLYMLIAERDMNA
jgi:hypothetical protein